MSDKFPVLSAESGVYRTTTPNPHVDLDGLVVSLGAAWPSRTFAATAADANCDFDNGDTCAILIIDSNNPSNALYYTKAVWNDAATDYFDLSSATLEGRMGTIANGTAVSVIAQWPSGRMLPDAESATQGDVPQVDANGNWVIV